MHVQQVLSLPGSPSAVRYQALEPQPVPDAYTAEVPWLVSFDLSLSLEFYLLVLFWCYPNLSVLLSHSRFLFFFLFSILKLLFRKTASFLW